jgi:hypothetical protein
MSQFEIPKGTTLYWGAPAKPMPEERRTAVAQLVATTPGIAEAYLPQCYGVGFVDPPAQVLVITLTPGAHLATVMQAIGTGISRIFPPGEHLDILPGLDRGTIQTIRQHGTQIYGASAPEPQPWWKRAFSRGT